MATPLGEQTKGSKFHLIRVPQYEYETIGCSRSLCGRVEEDVAFFLFVCFSDISEGFRSSGLLKVVGSTTVNLVRRLCGGGREELLPPPAGLPHQRPLGCLSVLLAYNAAASAKHFRDSRLILKHS